MKSCIKEGVEVDFLVLWEGVVNPDDLLSPQQWLAQLFDQPPKSTLQSHPILKRSRPTDPDPKQLIITKRVCFRNGSSSMRDVLVWKPSRGEFWGCLGESGDS